jgi:A/G-specific adenine glycosylase
LTTGDDIPWRDWLPQRLLAWFDDYGRKDLPWQHNPTPYRVWVSEIMLQQTQVTTVIDYYQRFMQRFPILADLAEAPLDDVLHLWSGLGYYARGRNLHRCARIIVAEHNGVFPDTLEAIMELPGIGRSTAGAILALAHGQRQAILDGNVKRVLCRFAAIDGWPGKQDVQRRLWRLAEAYTPSERVGAYTQAIMDLGAGVCRRGQPDCDACPLSAHCRAHELGRERDYPESRPRKPLPVRTTQMLLLRDGHGQILLQRRPPAGIWGGLWSLPEFPDNGATAEHWIRQQFGGRLVTTEAPFRHTFSHFHLDITPLLARVDRAMPLMDDGQSLWYNPATPQSLGLAAPIMTLLSRLDAKPTDYERILE